MNANPSSPTLPPALIDAVVAILRPLASLAVAKGLPARDLEELLRVALVKAAIDAQPSGASARQVSRIATATGLTRREVTRLLAETADGGSPTTARRSPATEVFARWIGDPGVQGGDGRPRELPRQGPAPSFEALALSVTRDVHPRSLLDTLVLLGLAEFDEARGVVRLLKDRYVPSADDQRLWSLLGANVSDHLAAAVGNVLGATPRHLEQALFADGVSEASLPALRELVQAQWQGVLHALVPAVQKLIDEDRAAGRTGSHRIRIGLYGFTAPAATPVATARPARARAARKPDENNGGDDDES